MQSTSDGGIAKSLQGKCWRAVAHPPLSLQIVLVAHSQTHCLTFSLWLLCSGAAECVCGLLASDINLLVLFMKGLPTPAVH